MYDIFGSPFTCQSPNQVRKNKADNLAQEKRSLNEKKLFEEEAEKQRHICNIPKPLHFQSHII